MKSILTLLMLLIWAVAGAAQKPIKLFVLAGDECVLENAPLAAKGKDGKPLPGTLESVVAGNDHCAFLKDKQGAWVTRDDVLLYDAHPTLNNTRAPGSPLKVGAMGAVGPERSMRMGVDLTLGHQLGDAIDEPVLILRYATWHNIWFQRGFHDLGHDYRPPSSGGGTDHEGGWDVIHFNFGVHDTAYRNPADYKDKNEKRYPICVPIDRYEANLRAMVAKMKKTGATLVWATVTPLHPDTPGWKAGDEDKYNVVALKVMQENGVLINDLNAESKRQGFPKKPDVHSVGNLGARTTEAILAAIAARQKNSKPLPRVLLIGDSITGSYQEQVMKDLDGKAYVFKNPANAGNTDFGLANIDAWIDLKSYLQNGEAYLGLVMAVRNALDNPGLVYPGYQGQGFDLAGLFWFQGIADTASPSKAAEYETHLANLIRDLRKDLNKPGLPVVVTALANNTNMSKQHKQVYAAQLAMGDAVKYPDFAGNVASVDTLKSCKSKAESPGGRDPYSANTSTYLEIGEAMGKTMLGLLGTSPIQGAAHEDPSK